MAKFHPDLDLMTEYSAGTLPFAQATCISVHIGYCEQCQRLADQLSDIGAALFEKCV
jgi:putative transcriptional regulator